jgi:UDP-N-acetylmuramoylalanine--D-glutamate ligase
VTVWRAQVESVPMTSSLAGQDVLVLGLGESGLAAARLAHLHGARVTVLDSGRSPVVQERAAALRQAGVGVVLEGSGRAGGPAPDLAVISPGIPYTSALGELATRLTCPLISELELGYRLCACPILAVTGTNGKTTTVELLTHCLTKAGLRVQAAGNIGVPLCEAALGSQALDLMVVEVSSFQLEKADRFAPLAAAITNITPDHLDRHGDMATYVDTKARLLRHLADPADAILRSDLAADPRLRAALTGEPTTFSSSDDGVSAWYATGAGDICWRPVSGGPARVILPAARIPLPGRHNLENILTVLALAQRAGIDPAVLAPQVASFALGPHRLELVATHGGIRFINDSKATNPDALVRALEAVAAEAGRPSVLLLAGGLDKNVSFAGLEPVIARYVRGVFLVGTSRQRLAKLWGDVVSCGVYESLDDAFVAAVAKAIPGDVVLLSPGCASQDMFTNYGERGRAFRSMVQRRFGE